MRHLITSALPYVNGVKHLGNLVGSMLPADIYARYLRACGEEVLFICATDEHGSPTEIAARAQGISPAEFCDQQYKIQTHLNSIYDLSFDYFGRSSSKSNADLVQFIAKKLESNGLIEERSLLQYYSEYDEMFLPDRFIIGTCPHCGYDNARGDQCESCTKVLDPEELISPRSAISGSSNLKLMETKHLFLCQSKMIEDLRKWINEQSSWPKIVQSIAKKWLNEGLKDRCITRDLKWGVPVNKKGYENKVFYVWFDAPIAYISSTLEWVKQDPKNRKFNDWWGAESDVKYTQFMGKDNIPFHTISFPATIIGSGNKFKQPDFIKGVNWLNYYGGKFSTSSKRGVFMNQAIDLFPSDYWRYSLMALMPEKDDVNFTWEEFAKIINTDLANSYGNLVQRTLSMQKKYFGDRIPNIPKEGNEENCLVKNLSLLVSDYNRCFDMLEFRKSTCVLNKIFKEINKYFEQKAPWKKYKEGLIDDVALTLAYTINSIRLCSILTAPIMPNISKKVYNALHLTQKETRWPKDLNEDFIILKQGHLVDLAPILFEKIMPDRIEQLRATFGDDKTKLAMKGKELHINIQKCKNEKTR